MTTRRCSTAALIGFGLLLVAATVVAFAIAGDLGSGLVCGAIVLAYLAFVVVGRTRSQTAEALSGIGDERIASINRRAVAFAGNMMAAVLPGTWLVSVALGDPNGTAAVMSAVMGVSYIVAAAVLTRRS